MLLGSLWPSFWLVHIGLGWNIISLKQTCSASFAIFKRPRQRNTSYFTIPSIARSMDYIISFSKSPRTPSPPSFGIQSLDQWCFAFVHEGGPHSNHHPPSQWLDTTMMITYFLLVLPTDKDTKGQVTNNTISIMKSMRSWWAIRVLPVWPLWRCCLRSKIVYITLIDIQLPPNLDSGMHHLDNETHHRPTLPSLPGILANHLLGVCFLWPQS